MNKSRFTILLLIVALFTGFSAEAKFGFGPKVGLNVNKLHFSGSDLLDASNRCGVTAGITAEYIAPALGIGADISLMYTHMKTSVSYDQVTSPAANTKPASYNVSGNFIEIPLHLKYKLGLPVVGSIISPYVFTGPNVAVKLSGSDSYFDTKKTQWGWDLGIGVELIRHLQIGAGYTWGLNKVMEITNMDEVAGVTVSNDIKVKNNYWTVTAAWMF